MSEKMWGLYGTIPHFKNPFIALRGTAACRYDSPKMLNEIQILQQWCNCVPQDSISFLGYYFFESTWNLHCQMGHLLVPCCGPREGMD